VEKLQEVIDRFETNDPLAAIGAFADTTEIALYVDTILERSATLARRYGQAPES